MYGHIHRWPALPTRETICIVSRPSSHFALSPAPGDNLHYPSRGIAIPLAAWCEVLAPSLNHSTFRPSRFQDSSGKGHESCPWCNDQLVYNRVHRPQPQTQATATDMTVVLQMNPVAIKEMLKRSTHIIGTTALEEKEQPLGTALERRLRNSSRTISQEKIRLPMGQCGAMTMGNDSHIQARCPP